MSSSSPLRHHRNVVVNHISIINLMGLFSNNRTVVADMSVFTLIDILSKLKEENFFNSDQPFYLIEVVNDNHLIFGVPRDRATPRQIHEFQYFEKERIISIKSKYKTIFFPSLSLYAFLITTMILVGKNAVLEQWKEFGIGILITTLFILISGTASLIEGSKNIEREIAIRLNYLLREKGYRMKL